MQSYSLGNPTVFPLGRLASSIAAATVLSAYQGSAYSDTDTVITSLTATYSILAPNSPAQLLFTTALRQVPIRLLCLPYDTVFGSVATTSWFVTA
jgi:hypothetical protein